MRAIVSLYVLVLWVGLAIVGFLVVRTSPSPSFPAFFGILVISFALTMLWNAIHVSYWLKNSLHSSASLPLGDYQVLAYVSRSCDRTPLVILDRFREPYEAEKDPETLCVWLADWHLANSQSVLKQVGSRVRLVKTADGTEFLPAEAKSAPECVGAGPINSVA